ncbi:peptide ABC transporter ATP-binding protein, partial [Methylobacterium tarhaniae]
MPFADPALATPTSLAGDARALVSLRDVRKSYGAFEVLKGISLDIRKGEVVCIIGPSGSGKSTLIRCINGLSPIQGGSITVDG